MCSNFKAAASFEENVYFKTGRNSVWAYNFRPQTY